MITIKKPNEVPEGRQYRNRCLRTHTMQSATMGTRKMWLYSSSKRAQSYMSRHASQVAAIPSAAIIVAAKACHPVQRSVRRGHHHCTWEARRPTAEEYSTSVLTADSLISLYIREKQLGLSNGLALPGSGNWFANASQRSARLMLEPNDLVNLGPVPSNDRPWTNQRSYQHGCRF